MLTLLVALVVHDAVAVSALGHEKFVVRETASRSLLAGDPTVRLGLFRHLAIYSPDPEVSRRGQRLYRQARDRWIESLSPMPFIDTLWYDPTHRIYSEDLVDAEVHALARSFVWQTAGRSCPAYPDVYGCYRMATRLWVTELVDLGSDPRTLAPMVLELQRRTEAYLADLAKWRSASGPSPAGG